MLSIEDIQESQKARKVVAGLLLVLCTLSLIATITSFTICVCDLSQGQHHVPTTITKTVSLPEHPINNTLTANCSQSLYLNNDMYVHVCWYGEEVLIDIRQFVNDKASIKGIGLKKSQWTKLIQQTKTVNKYILELEFEKKIFAFNAWHL